MHRRSRYDPLAISDRPRWLVVKDMHGAVLDSTVIPASTALHGLMVDAIARRQAPDGWTVENDGAYGFLFCHMVDVGRMVTIVQVYSAVPMAGAYAPQPVLQPARASA